MKWFKPNKLELTDEVLLANYLETGNLETLGELFNKYTYLVYGVCLKYFNDRDDSKDAVNKIFELLITEVPKYDIKNFRSWLYVVSKHFCLMELRRRTAEKRRFEKYSAEFMESTEILHPIDEELNTTLEAELKNCLEQLKEEQLSCIRMFYYEELCYKEIALHLKTTEGIVKSFIQNGRRNLKLCMEKKHWTEERKNSFFA